MIALLLAFLAAAPISITTRDYVQFAPGNVRVRVEIEPHKDNHRWCLEWDGPKFYSRSCEQIDDGLDAPRIYQRLLKDLPAGAYTATATIHRAGGDAPRSVVRFEIKGLETEDEGLDP